MEAADTLLGDAVGGFGWTDGPDVRFRLRAESETNPFGAVLEFLAAATPRRCAPVGFADDLQNKDEDEDQAQHEDNNAAEAGERPGTSVLELSETFVAARGDRMSLPIRLGGGNWPTIELGHWADGSSRVSFKLYAGNRSAEGIARAMLMGVRDKPKKGSPTGELRTKGIRQLWDDQRNELIARPFHVLTPMGGSFNFDPRGAWTAIDAGYSLNDQGHLVEASPVVEMLAAWGLEHARPVEFETRKVRYAAWGELLPPILARAALCGSLSVVPLRYFRFELDMSGKNKVVTFA
ncbi:MAG: hypothetical protein AB7F74_16480, partial [Parvibaculaceae bacterium]